MIAEPALRSISHFWQIVYGEGRFGREVEYSVKLIKEIADKSLRH